MSFNIKIPYVISTHVKKFTSTTALVNKSKAAAIGMVSGQIYVNNGTTVVPLLGNSTVTASGGTTRTLVAASSGSTNLFDSAAGIAYTLPAPVVGLSYRFIWTVAQTSAAHVVVTATTASQFLVGGCVMFSGEDVTPSATLGPKAFAANGTSHVQFSSNATTTGSGLGSWLEFTCVSATIWHVNGVIKSPSGSIATPFLVA